MTKRKKVSKQPPRLGKSAGSNNYEVIALEEARREAREILNPTQYWQAVLLVRRLVDWGNREATSDLSIRQFGGFWELRIKGGFIKINLRIYFAVIDASRQIVVLKTYKKEEDRRTCPSVMLSLEDRLEDYLAGRQRKQARHKSTPRD